MLQIILHVYPLAGFRSDSKYQCSIIDLLWWLSYDFSTFMKPGV